MFKPQKTAAFIMSLLICAVSAAAPIYSVSADDEAPESSVYETSAAEESLISSGDYKYSLTSDNNVCIEEYSGSEENVVIPDTIDGLSVKEIGSGAFFESSAVSVHIPSSVDYIYENPFLDASGLKEITADEGNSTFFSEDGILYEKSDSGNILRCYPQGKEGSSFAVPDGVTKIGTAALYSTKLSELTLPDSLGELERHCFSYNQLLKKIDFSGTAVTEISIMAMAECSTLTEVVFPDSLISIESAAFAGCKALSHVDLPDSLVYIGQNAFAATGLKSVKIPSSVTTIDYCAFGYDENLEPQSDFTIIGTYGSAAQTYCTDSDDEYDYANNFTFIDSANADLYEEAESFEYETSGDYTYAISNGEAYITACVSTDDHIDVPAEFNGIPVTKIYAGAFFQNQASEITLPDSVKSIGSLAFYLCSNLKTLNLPEGLESIDNQAFSDCTSLETLYIPGTCTSIGDEVFLNCSSIREFTAGDSENAAYSAENGVLYNRDKTVLIAYPPAKTDKSFTAPKSVKEIGTSAFLGALSLEKADISSVITINSYAFEGCSKLSSVKFSKDLELIGEAAFYNCNSLKSVRLYDNIKEIDAVALGYVYGEVQNEDSSSDEESTSSYGDVLLDGFVIYAPEDSGGAGFAQLNDIKCVTNTVGLFGYNIEKGFIYGIFGTLAALLLMIIGIITGKKIKKSRSEKETERLKQSVREKLEKKNEADNSSESEEENESQSNTK